MVHFHNYWTNNDTILLTKPHNLFGSHEFSPSDFFVPGSHPGCHIIFSLCLLCPLWSVNISDIPCFWWPDRARYCQNVSQFEFMVFSWLVWILSTWEDNRSKVTISSSPIKSICYHNWWCWPVQGVCASFLTARLLFVPFPHFILFWCKSWSTAHSQGMGS